MDQPSTAKGVNVRYVAVARMDDRAPLAQYNPSEVPDALYEEKLEKVLRSSRIREHSRLTITDHDVGAIHYDSDLMCLYLVVCAPEYPQRTAFKFLGDLRRSFTEMFSPETVAASKPFGLSKVAKQPIKDLTMRYNTLQNVDHITQVAVQVDEVKGAMQNNIQSALRNQENIENLVDKTDLMRNDASTFQRTTVQVKNKMWWRNAKLMIVICVLFVVLILIIVLPLVLR